jgi:hypothetical protein
MNPRADGEGGQYYDPPNTAGGAPIPPTPSRGSSKMTQLRRMPRE